ncbi:MAG: RagB/SusD family nutrient uptake outer membrane protein [Flavobacteriaceae bacterium]
MKNIIYISLITLALGTSSCSNDFLDRDPSFLLLEGNTISDVQGAEGAVNGIYDIFRIGREESAGHYVGKASQSGFVNWNQGDFDFEYTQTNITTFSIEARWSTIYATINASNFAINGIIDLGVDEFESEEAYNSLLAEARCWRAWAHMNIFWNYGHWWSDDDTNPYGVLYREQLADISNLQQARLNVGESYQKIFEDLDFAITHMNSLEDKGNRFLSKEFAKVIKAKALLRRGGMNDNIDQLNESLTLVNDVLNSPPAGFAMQADLAQVYQDSWDSQENLFVGYLENDGATSELPFDYEVNISTNFSDELDPDNPTPADELTAGLNFGANLFREDPRWPIVTGESGAERESDGRVYTWTKVTRLSRADGEEAGDFKYNTYFFRFPELYIMRSELLARTGASIAEAIAPINTMRSIRTNPILPSLNPTNQQELMDAIFLEYFFEIFLENGSEFYASLRFDTANGSPWIETTKGGKSLIVNSICFPIPPSEMLANRLMIQNVDLE